MRFLSPLGALAVLAVLVPIGAALYGRTLVRYARRELALQGSPSWRASWRLGCAIGAVALLGLAAAQPALTHTSAGRERSRSAALFVLDISRSMAASSTPRSPTRLDRAALAAVRLRSAIADVPSGVATLTDRTLPALLPVGDVGAFYGVVRRSVAIEQPPPAQTSVIATSYRALRQIASGNYFEPGVRRRVVILLSDGESSPFNPRDVASALRRSRGYRFVSVRFWNPNEQIFGAGGRPDPGYHPNPEGAATMRSLAAALHGRAFSEGQLGSAASYLRSLAETGPSVASEGLPDYQTLAPFVALVAVVLLAVAVVPASVTERLHAVWRAH